MRKLQQERGSAMSTPIACADARWLLVTLLQPQLVGLCVYPASHHAAEPPMMVVTSISWVWARDLGRDTVSHAPERGAVSFNDQAGLGQSPPPARLCNIVNDLQLRFPLCTILGIDGLPALILAPAGKLLASDRAFHFAVRDAVLFTARQPPVADDSIYA